MKNLFSKAAIILAASMLFGCSSDSDSNEEINNVQCPPGFKGQNCDIPLVPSKIKITAIRVLNFPNLDGGTGWDGPGTAPDIYLVISKGGNDIFTSDTYYKDAVSDNSKSYEFILPAAVPSTKNSDIFDIQLWDYDQNETLGGANDFIGGIYFAPFTEKNKKSVIVTDQNGKMKYEVFLSYEW